MKQAPERVRWVRWRTAIVFCVLGCMLPSTRFVASCLGGGAFEWRTVTHRAFETGEHLSYEVLIGIMNAGSATLSLPDSQWISGRPCHRALCTLASNALFDQVYSVRDTLESSIDRDAIFPWRSRERIEEGKYRSDRITLFDPRRGLVIASGDTKEAPSYVQDLLSVFYYVRTLPMRVGMSHSVSVFTSGDLLSFPVRVVSKEPIIVPAGTFECYCVEPGLRWHLPDGSEGKLTVWFAADESRMPVLMKTNLLFGALEAQIRLSDVRP